MAKVRKLEAKRVYMGKLDHGADLLEEITTICKDNAIRLGRVEAIGAVQKAKIGFYPQDTKQYEFIEIDKEMEITGLIGNISLKEGTPMVHAHINLGDEEGRVIGGHLAPGTIVFACEVIIQELAGEDFNRGLDETTGLPLWEL